MRVVLQRVSRASVTVPAENYHAEIGGGLLVLAAFIDEDTVQDLEWTARKIAAMRIFDDRDGVMNLSVKDVGGDVQRDLLQSGISAAGRLRSAGGSLRLLCGGKMGCGPEVGLFVFYIASAEFDTFGNACRESGGDRKNGERASSTFRHAPRSGLVFQRNGTENAAFSQKHHFRQRKNFHKIPGFSQKNIFQK